MSEYQPSLTAFKLRKRVSQRTGNEYLFGFWGQLKVVVLKSSETADDGSEIYNVILQQAEDRRQRQDAKPTPAERSQVNEPLRSSPKSSSRPMPNDAIPF